MERIVDLIEGIFAKLDEIGVRALIEKPEERVCDAQVMDHWRPVKERSALEGYADTASIHVSSVLTLDEMDLPVKDRGQRENETLVWSL